MSPEQLAALTQLSHVVSQMGTWPIGTILLIIILGPWVILIIISRAMEKRFDAQKLMYETNVRLVEKYEQMAGEQADTIRLATAATTELTTFLRTRTPCHQLLSANLSAQLKLTPGSGK
ncbi:MAG: hypothetical protein LLG97_19585 [Deltaproteobacteria bacterium]|nr:hypothetical protein [Deltaproteobacteria bacterium]